MLALDGLENAALIQRSRSTSLVWLILVSNPKQHCNTQEPPKFEHLRPFWGGLDSIGLRKTCFHHIAR